MDSTASITEKAVEALRRHYGDRYIIRRHGSLWVATTRDPESDAAPTLIEEDLERFVASLEFPSTRAGRPLRMTTAHP